MKRGVIIVIVVGFFGWTPFGWTPRLSLLKGKANFHSLRPFSLHNDILYERQVLKAIQLPNAPRLL